MSLITRLNIDAIEDGSIPLVKLEEEIAAADHTHHEIDNDFTITTYYDDDNIDGTIMSVTSDNGVNIGTTYDGDTVSMSVTSDNGVNINAYDNFALVYDTLLSVKDTGVDVRASNDMDMEETYISVKSNNVSIDSGGSIYLTSNKYNDNGYKHINIADNIDIGCYYEDMDYTKEDVIRIDEHNGVEITSSVEDEYTQNQSSILNKSGEINITAYYHSDDGMDSYYVNDTNILLRKTETSDSEIVIAASKKSHYDNGEEIEYNNTSGEITISASAGGSNIELSADNIIIKSNSNSASNKVFTTNGGIATLPSSLPANGGNADTVDGKHASDFAVANHNHTMILNGSFTPEINATYDNGTLIISGNVSEVQYTGTTDVENTNANPESWFVEADDIRALFAN